MKRAVLLAFLPVTLFLNLAPLVLMPHSKVAASTLEGGSPQPETFNSSTDTNSSTSSVEVALLGHWTTNSGRTHYYVGENQLIVMNLLPRQNQSQVARRQELEYTVVNASEKQNFVRLLVETSRGWTHTRTLRFSPDRKTITETLNVLGHSFSNELIYIDDRQEP